MSESDTSAVAKLGELKAREQELLRRRVAPRILCEDVTGEKMTLMLQMHGETMASLSSDARSAAKIVFGKYVGKGTDEDPYLKGFSGDSTRQDRMGRPGASLDAPALSVAWAVQPDIFNQIFNHKVLADSGLVPRFIACRVEPDLSTPSFDEASPATPAEIQFHSLIVALLAVFRQHTGGTHIISADSDARQVFIDYQRDISAGIRTDYLYDIRTFAMRWAEIAWKIALIFHCAEHREAAHMKQLSVSTAVNAVRTMKWFAHHQQDLLAEAAKKIGDAQVSAALGYVNRSVAGVTARDVQREYQSLFGKVADARAALEQLQSEGAITSEHIRNAKRYLRKRPTGKQQVSAAGY